MGNFGYGQAQPNDSNDDFAAVSFICRQMMAEMATSKLVLVQAVNGGGVAPAGTVDVLPLVQQIDGNFFATPHGTVHGIPWSRVQGGKSAVICDPMVGDVGYVVAQDRDFSKVKANAPVPSGSAGYPPGSWRRFDIADGVYAGGCLNVAPDQYLVFTTDGIRLVDKNGNSLAFSADGFAMSDQAGNSVASSTTGMTLTIPGGNKIIMEAGFVNIVAPVLQVNGVPVTVP